MTAVLKNLRSFLREHTVFFILMLVCICVSSGLMLFGYGLYQNYMLEKKDLEGASIRVTLETNYMQYIGDQEYYVKCIPTKAQMQECLEKIPNDTMTEIWFVFSNFLESNTIGSELDFMRLESRFNYINENYIPYSVAFENGRKEGGYEGRFYTEEEYANAEHKLIVSKSYLLDNVPAQIGDMVTINGEEFEIIAKVGNMHPEAVFPAIPDSMYAGDVTFLFNRPPTYTEYNSIKTAFEPIIGTGGYEISEYEPFYDENYWLYNTIIIVSVLIAVVAAFNIVVIYQYVLVKRQKSLAVFQICGCTKGKAIRMYVAESLLMIIPSFCAIAAIYHFALLPLLQNVFPFIATAYSLKLYVMAFGIYITICTIGTTLLANTVVRKYSIVELKGGTTVC